MTPQDLGHIQVTVDNKHEGNLTITPGFTIVHYDELEDPSSTAKNGIAGRVLNKRDGHVCGPVCFLLVFHPEPEI